jgi:UDP-N-acetylmuramoyl-tripeptide--D-alanyl-D-alanine ligase
MASRAPGKVVFFGQSEDCDLVAKDVKAEWPERLSFSVNDREGELQVQTKLVGTHWLSSALAAIAAARTCGVPSEKIALALAGMSPFTARMQPVKLPNGAVLIRDEAGSAPDSLEAMVNVLAESRAERKVLVFSDLEGSRLKAKYRLREPGRIAAAHCQMAVFVGEHGHRGVNAAVSAGMAPEDCYDEPTLQGAAQLLKRLVGDGDLVFIKGRSADHLTRIVLAQFGEIGCWITNCRLQGMCDSCSRLTPNFDVKSTLAAAASATETAGAAPIVLTPPG